MAEWKHEELTPPPPAGSAMAAPLRDDEEFAPLPRAIKITGLGKSMIYRGVRENWFPPPVKIGRKSLWPVSWLHGWVNRVIKEKAGNDSPPEVGTR